MKKYILVIILFLLTSLQVLASDIFTHWLKKERSNWYCYKFEINNNTQENIENWNIKFDLQDQMKSNYSGVFTNNNEHYTVTGVWFNEIIKVWRHTRIWFCAKGKIKPQNIVFNNWTNSITQNIIFEQSFNSNWLNSWNIESSRQWWFNNIEVIDDYLKVNYPALSYKPSAQIVWWAWFIKKLNTTWNDYTLSYDIKFDEDFDFVKWGKLPGLCWWSCPTWSEDRNSWFSTRFMWRTNGDTEIYAYIADKETGYWTSFGRWNARFETNKWYNISQRIKLNDIWTSNWIIEYFINWEKVFSKTWLNITNNPDVKIDAILFSTFFGGWDNSWATPKNTNTYFKNFKVISN